VVERQLYLYHWALYELHLAQYSHGSSVQYSHGSSAVVARWS